jgi:hypothetical protein
MGHLVFSILFFDTKFPFALPPWHFVTEAACCAFVLPIGATLAGRLLRSRKAEFGFVIVCLLALAAFVPRTVARLAPSSEEGRRGAGQLDAATWLRKNLPPGERLAGTDCGLMSFFSGRDVINLDGLTNDRAYQHELAARALKEYLDRNGVRWLCLYGVEAPRGILRVRGAERRETYIYGATEGAPVFVSGDRQRAIWDLFKCNFQLLRVE